MRRGLIEQLEGRRLLAADALINEFVFNHTGTDTDEYVEVVSTPNTDLSSYSVVIVDGDGGAAGSITKAMSLGTTNSSGLIFAGGTFGNLGLQNGSQTALLVKDFTGSEGDDLDTDNDGTLDSTPWSEIIDDVAVDDGGASDRFYSSVILSPAAMNDDIPFTVGAASRIPNGLDTDSTADWARNDFDGDGLTNFGGETFTAPVGAAINTPLSANFVRDPFDPGMTIIQSGSTTDVSESGTTDSFEIALKTNPTSAVTVTVTPDSQIDLGAGAGTSITLTFLDKAAQSVTVSANDDLIVEAAIHSGLISISTASSDSDYNNKSASVTVNIADNDTPAPLAFLNEFVINHAGIDIDEFIEIKSSPAAVLSTLTLINIDGDVSFDAGLGEIQNADPLGTADANGYYVIHPTTEYFDGPNLVLVEGFNAAVGTDVDVDDDGVFDWEQSPVPAGGLSAAPWTSIRDAVSVPGDGDASYGFTELSVTALNDGNGFEAGGASRLPDATAATTSASEWVRNDFSGQGLPNYDPFSADPSVPGTALNTPGASNSLIGGLLVSQSDDSTAVTEGGAGDTLTLTLGGPVPTADVIVTITPDAQLDLGAGAGVAITETFSAPSQGPISINVDAFDDSDVEGLHGGDITFSISSSDANYDGQPALAVSVTITDNEVGGETPQVVISEIMYNPNGDDVAGEWIEIVNVGSTPVDLTNWRFDDEDSTDWGPISSGTLTPGQVAVIFNQTAGSAGQFRADWGVPSSALVIGVSWGSLANSPTETNEILQLLDANSNEIDLVNYDDSGDWPSDPGGPSIYLTNLSADNNVGTNWAQTDVDADPVQDPVPTNPGGAVFDVTDEGSPGWVPSMTGDTTAPEVIDVIVAGVGGTFPWSAAFIDAVDGGGNGAGNGLGFSVLGANRTVPWYQVDTIYIQFNEDVNVSAADLFGSDVADYAGNFTLSTSGSLTTLSMTSPFGLPESDLGPATTGIDKLLLQLQAAAVTDLAGNPLDSDFTQRIDLLPGDGNGDGTVNNFDVGLTNLRGFTSIGGPANGIGFSYDSFFDVTADGNINSFDVGLTNFQGFDQLPTSDPTPSGGGSGSASSDDDDSDWASLVDLALAGGLF